MNPIKTPDSVIAELDQIKTEVAQRARLIQDAEKRALEADRLAKREFALAYKRASGSVEDRKQQATIDADDFFQARDDAQIALNYLRQRSKDLEQGQMNLQTQARLVEITYRLAGVGEP